MLLITSIYGQSVLVYLVLDIVYIICHNSSVFIYHFLTKARMINYPARLAKLRTLMEKQNIGLVYLTAGANLFYLTGIHTRDDYRTDHNRYGDYVVGGYIGLDGGVTVMAARMGAQYFVDEMQGKLWFEPPRLIIESEEPLDALKEIVSRFVLEGKRVALDDHAWAQSMFAFRNILPETPFILASDLVTPMRMIKEQAEIELMRQAGDITDTVWWKTLSRLKVGVTEFDMAGEIDYQFRVAGAQYNSFPTTVRFRGPAHADEAADTKPTERTL
jgi:Xaa-Pro dipeptidase